MAFAHVGAVALQHVGGHAHVPVGFFHHHGIALTRQVAAQHGYASGYGCHHGGPIGGPGPGSVAPAQRLLNSLRRRVDSQACGRLPGIGHFQHQGGQFVEFNQGLHRRQVQPLVLGGVVLLAQQQHVSGAQLVQAYRHGGVVGCGGVCARAW